MKRASLVKAGHALAPEAFVLMLDSESKDVASSSNSKQAPSYLDKLAARVECFDKAVVIAMGHLKRLGSHNNQER